MDLTTGKAGLGLLTDQELHDTVAAALARLKADGVSPELLARLANARYEVGDLSGGLLGYTYATDRTVVISPNAAGYGWFLDPTPLQDEEFVAGRPGTPLTARPGTAAGGEMDLLTVVLHEMGHLAGKKDDGGAGAADDLMATFLAPGVRRTDALDAVFGGRG
jgi:hypothetical protein